MLNAIDQRQHAEQHADDGHDPGMAAAGRDNAGNRRALKSHDVSLPCAIKSTLFLFLTPP
jgi:hypothetical protein